MSVPEEMRFTFVSKVGFFHGMADRSSTFNFGKVKLYLEMIRKNDIYTYELVLHRADHSESSIEPFDVAVQLEKTDRQIMSVVFSRVTITSLPETIWKFHTGTVYDYKTKVRLPDPKDVLHEIKIVCTFRAHPPSEIQNLSTRMTNSNFSSHLESLSEDFSNLLKNEVLPDVKLRCGDLIVPAHKLVLTARSEVFAAMFSNEMSESRTGAVNVEDLDEGVFDLFLKYLYSGKIAGVPDDVLSGLYAAADKYAVKALKTWCRERMIRSLTEQNCISFLTAADAHSDADFKREVISFICSHASVLKSEAWLVFCKEPSKLVVEVLQSFAESKTKKS